LVENDFDVMIMTNPTNDPNQMLSTQEAAALLGLQPCTLAAWREDGSQPSLAFFKLGKAVRYRYADLLAFIENRKASSTLTARQIASPPVLPVSRAPTRSRPPAPALPPQEKPICIEKTAASRKKANHLDDRQQSLF
jgi:hypothetical protein